MHKSVNNVCHHQWQQSSQSSPMGPDPGGAYTEAVTPFLQEMCTIEALSLEEISGSLTPGRSSSLFSPEERRTMLSWASAGCLQGRQHHCHSHGTGSPSRAPAAGWTLGQEPHGGTRAGS